MTASHHMKILTVLFLLAVIIGVVSAHSDFSLRSRYLASSTGDLVLPGLQKVTHEGYLRLARGTEVTSLTNITVAFQAENITTVDDSDYARMTRSSVRWVYPADYAITGSKVLDWSTDTDPVDNVTVTFSRTLNRTTFATDGYQLVRCNVTFWNTSDIDVIWGEVDNYRRDKVNVTILNSTFRTDLPDWRVMWQNDKQFQFQILTMRNITIGKPYSFSIILKIERINPAETVSYKPLCGINLIDTIALTSSDVTKRTITIPPSELPPFVHLASASIHESTPWTYWSHTERSALLLENSSTGTAPAVTTIVPASGKLGALVTVSNLSGSGFVTGAKVFLTKTGSPAIPATNVSVLNPGRIRCTLGIPASALIGPWNVRVINPDRQSGIGAGAFTVKTLLPPAVTAIVPASARQGTLVTITNLSGSGFVSGAQVSLTRAGSPAISATNISVLNSGRIRCTFGIPVTAPTGRWNVRVTNADRQYGQRNGGFSVRI